MNLLQIRKKVIQLSGRYDLVEDTVDWSDNGADFFINEGVKYLDRLITTQKSYANAFAILDVGQYLVTFPYCRAIKEIWVASTTVRWQLYKKPLQDILANYNTGLVTGLTNGVPLYYSPCVSRTSPETISSEDRLTLSPFIEIPPKIGGDSNAILTNIPSSEKLAVEIKGLFYSMELVEDTDSNYWSEVHSLLLCKAALRAIDSIYGTTQSLNNWDNSIAMEVIQIEKDLIDEIISEQDVMEGQEVTMPCISVGNGKYRLGKKWKCL